MLPEYVIQVLQNSLFFLAATVLCCLANWWFLLFLPPILAGFGFFGFIFKRVFTEYRRLENISRYMGVCHEKGLDHRVGQTRPGALTSRIHALPNGSAH